MKGKPDPLVYEDKLLDLREVEKLAEQGWIDLFYGDQTSVSSEGYVPYGWQFPDEKVAILVEKGYKTNILGLISRQNECHGASSAIPITSLFIKEFFEDFSFKIRKETFVVLDNAPIHQAKIIQERLPFWQNRGLFIFFLPKYSPHLNLAETLWRIMKGQWIDPEDYLDKDTLFYAVNRCMANVGKELKINFKPFKPK